MYDATTNASNSQSLAGFSKVFHFSSNLMDILLCHVTGKDRDSDKPQDINKHSMIPDGSKHQLLNYDFPKNLDGEATKSSSIKLQESNNKWAPRRDEAAVSIHRPYPKILSGITY